MTNGSNLNNPLECREMIDEFAPSRVSASVRDIDHDQLFSAFNIGTTHQTVLNAEVRMR